MSPEVSPQFFFHLRPLTCFASEGSLLPWVSYEALVHQVYMPLCLAMTLCWGPGKLCFCRWWLTDLLKQVCGLEEDRVVLAWPSTHHVTKAKADGSYWAGKISREDVVCLGLKVWLCLEASCLGSVLVLVTNGNSRL